MLPEARILDLDEVAVAVDLRVGRREVVALDDVGRELMLLEHRAPVGRRLPPERELEHLHHFQPIRPAALLVGVEARVVGLQIDERGKDGPPAVRVGHRERHPRAVRAHVDGAAHRVAGIEARDRLQHALPADREVRLEVEARTVHVAGEKRGVHLLPFAGPGAMVECREDAEREHDRGVHLAMSREDGRLPGLRQDRHHAGPRRGELVDRRQVGVWAFRSEARAAGVDQVRLDRHEGRVLQAEPREILPGSVGDHDVGLRDEIADERAAAFAREIHREALLVALRELRAAVPPTCGQLVFGPDGGRAAQVVDPDHLGAEITEQRRADPAPELDGEIDHADAVEGAVHEATRTMPSMSVV